MACLSSCWVLYSWGMPMGNNDSIFSLHSVYRHLYTTGNCIGILCCPGTRSETTFQAIIQTYTEGACRILEFNDNFTSLSILEFYLRMEIPF